MNEFLIFVLLVAGAIIVWLIEHSDAQKAIIATRIAPLLRALSGYAAGALR